MVPTASTTTWMAVCEGSMFAHKGHAATPQSRARRRKLTHDALTPREGDALLVCRRVVAMLRYYQTPRMLSGAGDQLALQSCSAFVTRRQHTVLTLSALCSSDTRGGMLVDLCVDFQVRRRHIAHACRWRCV